MSTKRKTILLLITLLLLAAGITLVICKSHFFDAKAATKPKKKKVIESTYYQLEIESPAEFTAIISTRASNGIIEEIGVIVKKRRGGEGVRDTNV